MKLTRFCLYSLFLLFFSVAGGAAEPDIEKGITNALAGLFPGLQVTAIRPAKIDGLYEVMMGAEVIYISADGRYFFQGNLYDLKHRRNLSEEQRSLARTEMLQNMPAADYIEFAPKDPQHAIYIFTDVDCGYCRRLHSEINEINKLGIAVRYLAFPRSGPGSKTFKEMENVWCAADRNKAMTRAKLGNKVTAKKCDNPVAREYALGQSMGVRGTPAIYLKNGKQIGGYLSPAELHAAVQSN